MPLSPTQAHAQLDTLGLLEASHAAGCYSLRLSVPDDPEARWLSLFDAVPSDGFFDRLKSAEAVAYCGASKDVYARIQEHAAARKRRAAILRAFPPVEVVDVTPQEKPFQAEYNYARRVSRWGFLVWTDGELI